MSILNTVFGVIDYLSDLLSSPSSIVVKDKDKDGDDEDLYGVEVGGSDENEKDKKDED